MKLVHVLLVIVTLAFVTACNGSDPTGPDTRAPAGAVYEEGGQHGSGG